MSLPLELVDEIVHHILDDAPPRSEDSDRAGKNSKPDWSLIHAFTLTCHAFRQLGLAAWFRQLYIPSASDINTIDAYFPLLKSQWCRHLHYVQPASAEVLICDLGGFQRLSSLRVDWLHKMASLQDESDDEVIPFINVKAQIRELDIRGILYPSPMLLKTLTYSFTHLVRLKLDFWRIWCGLCHTTTFVRLPTPALKSFLYKDGLGLPIHYARALLTLDSLEEVFIRLPDLGSSRLPSPGLSAESNDNLWVGECDRCISLMYDDEHFRQNWVARKQGVIENGVEERLVYKAPPCLKLVHWRFWDFDYLDWDAVATIFDEDDDWEADENDEPSDDNGNQHAESVHSHQDT